VDWKDPGEGLERTVPCLAEVVRQCVEKGILEGSGISIDTTHTEANTFKCTAERVMKRLAKKIFKTVEKECGEVPEEINQEIPNYKEIENHKEAKATMKSYLEETIQKIEETVTVVNTPKVSELLENAKSIINDPKFMEQKGVRSI
jgi:hypothetical protein